MIKVEKKFVYNYGEPARKNENKTRFGGYMKIHPIVKLMAF